MASLTLRLSPKSYLVYFCIYLKHFFSVKINLYKQCVLVPGAEYRLLCTISLTLIFTFTEGIGEGAGAKNHVFYYYYVEFQFIAMHHRRIYFTDKLKQVLKWIMEIIKTIIST